MAHLLLFPSYQEVIATCLIFVAGLTGTTIFARKRLLQDFPLSTSMVLGYIAYYFLLPPLSTLIEGKAIGHNLADPLRVALNATAGLFSLAVAHIIYQRTGILRTLRETLRRNVYRPAGFFQAPSNIHLLMIGSIGVLLLGLQTFFGGKGAEKTILDSIAQGFYPLTYVPYCILLKPLIGGNTAKGLKWKTLLAVYTIVLLIVSVAKNSRGELFMGVASVAIAYMYAIATGIPEIKRPSGKQVAVCAILLLTAAGPVADLALSMVITRAQREDVSALSLVQSTFDVYHDKDQLNNAKQLMSAMTSDWDERYVDNLFLARLANLKFTDNSIELSKELDSQQTSQIRQDEWDRFLSALPTPMLVGLGLNVDKNLATGGSGGDFLYATAIRSETPIGGYRTGSILGMGYALFGWYYILALIPIAALTFAMADALTSKRSYNVDAKHSFRIVLFNPLVVATYFSWFFYFTSAATGVESWSELGHWFVRGWIQIAFIYGLAYWSTYSILHLLSPVNRAPHR